MFLATGTSPSVYCTIERNDFDLVLKENGECQGRNVCKIQIQDTFL